jgi:chromosomal replication initiator protein
MEERNHELWQAVLGELELILSRASFTTWLKHTFIIDNTDGRIAIGVPNIFTREWLSQKYHQHIYKIIQDKSEERIKEITYRVQTVKNFREQLEQIRQDDFNEKKAGNSAPIVNPFAQTEGYAPTAAPVFGALNPRYSFDNYVIGKANELASAAARAVVENPGFAYNPLFIYGGVGLGKTHLMQAIGRAIYENSGRTKKVVYCTCEQFTNDFVTSIQAGHVDKFTTLYRSADVFLIDDIQFLTGKEGTQEAFFHTFNDLHQRNRQIVLTSDRPPKAISTLEDRLLSRFEWGMIADISQPDLETRVAILESKCREKKMNLAKEIIQYITLNIQNNVRELEGALNKIIAYYQLNHIEPTLENVKSILFSISSSSRKSEAITIKKMLEVVGAFYEISGEDLLGKSREKKLAYPRQIMMYLLREELRFSYPTIGAEIGGRDHTTAMHAYSKIARAMEGDEKLRQELNLLKQKLYAC